jgi:hypothetical protein
MESSFNPSVELNFIVRIVRNLQIFNQRRVMPTLWGDATGGSHPIELIGGAITP